MPQRLQAANFPIGGRGVYVGLLLVYGILALYSLSAFYLGATTIGRAVDPAYSRLFPALLFLSCLSAIVGVVISRWTTQVWIEYAGTAALLAGLFGYAVAIGFVGVVFDNDWSRVPPALIPIALMVFPTLRLLNILRTVAAFRARQLVELETGPIRVRGEVPPGEGDQDA